MVRRRYEHPVKGQGIYAYVTLNEGTDYQDGLKKELVQMVREQIGAPVCLPWPPAAPAHRAAWAQERGYWLQRLHMTACHASPVIGWEQLTALQAAGLRLTRDLCCAGAFAAPDVIHWAPGESPGSCSQLHVPACCLWQGATELPTRSSSCILPGHLVLVLSLQTSWWAQRVLHAGLPKTRSGKIMRRVLRKIAAKEEDQLGDTSTLAGACARAAAGRMQASWVTVRRVSHAAGPLL